ncbi:MAG: putative HoLLiday junction resolvase [Parachlamydiales bacterium]|nr:putative HoLLiday junction resolvase [Parachlamydiales bacterium]
MPRIAAVDFGFKRIGLAISDGSGRIALPLKMIAAGKSIKDSARLVLSALAPYEKELDMIIVGMPLLLSGKRGEMAEFAERFADALRIESRHKVETMDERLSSAQAEKALKEMDYSRKERTGIIDSTSATLILQSYLNRTV